MTSSLSSIHLNPRESILNTLWLSQNSGLENHHKNSGSSQSSHSSHDDFPVRHDPAALDTSQHRSEGIRVHGSAVRRVRLRVHFESGVITW